jgi:hypothetical protein
MNALSKNAGNAQVIWNANPLNQEERLPKSKAMLKNTILKSTSSQAPITFDAQNRLQSLRIRELLGGDRVNDSTKFQLSAKAVVQFRTKGAIAQLTNATGLAIINSDDGYESELTATLEAGNYELLFSTDASTPQPFESSLWIQYL